MSHSRELGAKECLIVFAKEPQKGKVKTRLEGYLSKAQCVNLYKAFLRDTFELVNKIPCEYKILAYESHGKDFKYLKKMAPHYIFYRQSGFTLGERMFNACKFAKSKDVPKIVIIGSDSPDLPASSIEKAFGLLDGSDVVLGPSFDGGYYLIGLKSACAGLFKGIVWSSAAVFKDTIENARKLKKKVALLAKRYDVDDAKALFHLNRNLRKTKNSARWTRKFLSGNKSKKSGLTRWFNPSKRCINKK